MLDGDSTLGGMSGRRVCLTRLNSIGTRDSELLKQDSSWRPMRNSIPHVVFARRHCFALLSISSLAAPFGHPRCASSPSCCSIPQRPKTRIHSLPNAQRHSGDYERLAEIAFHGAKCGCLSTVVISILITLLEQDNGRYRYPRRTPHPRVVLSS